MSDRIDAGDVLGQRATPIDPMETAGELARRLADLGPELVLDVLARHAAGTLAPEPQDDARATTARKLTKADGTVTFDQPAAAVQRRVHGLNPWPGCAVELDGQRIKLARVAVVDQDGAGGPPGTVGADRTVACRTGRVRLLEVQPPGGRPMPFDAWLNGHPEAAAGRLVPA